jgi:hypothetical protein
MKSLNTKLLLSALGVALLATPAFAQQAQWHRQSQGLYNDYSYQQANPVGVYPNGASRSGSAESVESGAEFNLMR